MSGHVVFASLGCAALLVATRSAAEPVNLAGSRINVSRALGAESCPDAASLKQRTLMLGQPRAHAGEPLRVSIEFRRDESGFAATVRTSGDVQGKRELFAAGASCEPLAHATSVVLAVLLDLLPSGERAGSPSRQAAASTPGTATNSGFFDAVALGVRPSVQYGLFGPALSESIGAEARFRLAHAEFVLRGFVSPGRSVGVGPGVVSASLAGGNLAVCGYRTPRPEAVDLGLCVLFSVASFNAKGRGFYQDGEAQSPWIAGGVGATLALSLGRHWALRSGVDLLVPLHQYRAEVARVGVAYDASPVAVAVSLGPEWRFR